MPFHVKNTNKQDKLMEREKKKRQFVSVCLPLYTFVWIPPSLITNSKSSTLNYIHPYKHHICSALNFYPTRNKKDKMTPTWSSEHNGNRAHSGDTFSSWQKSVPPLCFHLIILHSSPLACSSTTKYSCYFESFLPKWYGTQNYITKSAHFSWVISS